MTNPFKPTLSVIISTFTPKRWEQLLEAVSSVASQHVPAELVVVIDHHDELLEKAKIGLPEHYREVSKRSGVSGGSLKVLANTQPRGLSGARNSGVAAASGEIVAFLDDDGIAEASWLEELLEPYQNPLVLGVGGTILPRWPEQRRAPWFPEEFLWVLGCSYRGGPNTESPVRNFIGCNMSFRRTVLEKVGGFRTDLGRLGSNSAGGEETELCIRIGQSYPDGVLLHRPGARVWHQIAAERVSARYFATRCFAEGVSKAQIAGAVGATDALASERAYTTSVLPRGVVKGLRDALEGNPSGFARAAAILSGLGMTAAGYGLGTFERLTTKSPAVKAQSEAVPFEPVQILEVDLANPLPDLEPTMSLAGTPYRHAQVLVRQQRKPLGLVKLELPAGGLRAEEFAERIASQLPQATSANLSSAQVDSDQPFVSIIIATHNRTQGLAACLDSIKALAYPQFEVIVVDNAPSTSDTYEFVKADRSGLLRYVREDVAGLAVAHNRGILEARGEILAFTDDDVRVDRFWLAELVAGFSASKNVGCVTGMILPVELETAAQGLIEQYGGFSKGFALKIFDLERNRPGDPLYPYTAGVFGSGASMAFTRNALLDMGGFDPALGAGSKGVGGDDLAAFFEVVVRGYTLVYQPAALLYHSHRREYAGLQRQAYGYGVGLTAFLTKVVLDKPQRLFEMLLLMPKALGHVFSPASSKNAKKQADYPAELESLERQGMLYGPVAYLHSRWHLYWKRQGTSKPRMTDSARMQGVPRS